jgi:hypothetical protein
VAFRGYLREWGGGRACQVFCVSHGMANTVTLSQGKPSGEEDSQGIQSDFPAVRSGAGLASSLTGNVPQPEVDELHRRVVGWDVASVLGDCAEWDVEGPRSRWWCPRSAATPPDNPGTGRTRVQARRPTSTLPGYCCPTSASTVVKSTSAASTLGAVSIARMPAATLGAIGVGHERHRSAH